MDISKVQSNFTLAVTTVSLVITLCTILKKRKRVRRKRRWWIRPMLLDRKEKGQYHNLFVFIKNNDHEQFFKYTRMTVTQFHELLDLVYVPLTKKSRREPLSPEHRLVITLYYLAHGGSMQLTAWSFYVSRPTVSKIIKEVCKVLWDVLSPIYLSSPTTNEWLQIANQFYTTWNMPNCFGAMDGKHITVQAPKNLGSTWFNYKRRFSMVLMAVCDANYNFTIVDVRAFGSQHDASVLQESAFGQALNDNRLGVPDDAHLPESQTKFPYFLVADEAFPLKKYIMRPYPGSNLSETQRIFNYRLSRARRTIENTFGILASRWRILRTSIIADVTTVERIICTTLCLHNFIQKKNSENTERVNLYCPSNYVDTYDRDGNLIPGHWRNSSAADRLNEMGRMGTNNPGRCNANYRDTLAEYLISNEGEVPWQYAYVNRGSF